MEPIDEQFLARVSELCVPGEPVVLDEPEWESLLVYFDAQALSRHADFALRELQAAGAGYYTIGSSGHEANAAVALALRPTDPALLHYRSGGFYAARAGQVPGVSAAHDILAGGMASTADGISGGRHKVFGSVALNVIPQTSTIASHLPRAFGLAFALDNLDRSAVPERWPADAVVVCSLGDASVNHSTAQGALNAASYGVHRSLPVPLLVVCEDNGIGISTRTPKGWIERRLRGYPGIEYYRLSGMEPLGLLRGAAEVATRVRSSRRPAVLHLETVRLMGHAGSDAEIAYRSRREIEADYARDPLVAAASALIRTGRLTPDEVVSRYEAVRADVARCADRVPREHLSSAAAVMAPIAPASHARPARVANRAARLAVFRDRLPEDAGQLTLAQTINAALKDALLEHPQSLLLGEDIGRKGGVYGVTRGLRRAFGPQRVLDSILDEQTILGTSLGAALSGFLPIPEIQYLAYLHNAEDQLRGEAATLAFFSDGQYLNGMVVRIAGLAYQRGFGGHFHNDNSVAVLRDIPGLFLAVPSSPASAPSLLRQCIAYAEEGRVCVFLEPIALYHERDLLEGDGGWLSPYTAPGRTPDGSLRARVMRPGRDILIVTFGNGVRMSLRAAHHLARQGIDCEVLDLQWLAPLPVDDLLTRAGMHRRVLVADETRASGGVSEAVLTTLVDAGYPGRIMRVTSADSFVPLGPASAHVLMGESDIVQAAHAIADG